MYFSMIKLDLVFLLHKKENSWKMSMGRSSEQSDTGFILNNINMTIFMNVYPISQVTYDYLHIALQCESRIGRKDLLLMHPKTGSSCKVRSVKLASNT